jgi:hypothetical protein
LAHRIPRYVIAIAIWAGLWAVVIATGYSAAGIELWVILIVPQALLGFAVGRWWACPLPFTLALLTPIAPEAACTGCELDVPYWMAMLTFVAPAGGVAVGAGVAIRRLVDRRRAPDSTASPTGHNRGSHPSPR